MTNAKDTVPLLKPHARVEGHHRLVHGVKLRGHGRMLPFQHQDPGMKKFGQALHKLAEYPGFNIMINEVADKVTQLLCDLLGKRRCFIQGVPYCMPSLHRHGDSETIGSTLEEMARFCRDRWGARPHYARVYLVTISGSITAFGFMILNIAYHDES